MDPEIADFARSYRAFTEEMTRAAAGGGGELTPLGIRVRDFLGVASLGEVESVSETFPIHQIVDADLALESLLTEASGERYGISGPNRAHVDSFADFLLRSFADFEPGAVSYERRPTGPDSDRRVVSFGLGQLVLDGVPVAWLQRSPQPQTGREEYTVEVLSPRPDTSDWFLALVRERMAHLSVLRGQIISFASDPFSYHAPGSGLNFLRRPEVTAEEVILPPGVLDRVARHVVGMGEQREVLRDAGQHLKRGVLLYGPPGTGKTHLIRHLLSVTEGTTAVLLSGRTLGMLQQATQLARTAEPAIIVLEDCDLVAEERDWDSDADLFETLEAMDGLAPDADITFILTTNRVDLLERALVERPGRVDLAVEIARPDLEGRERLFRLYAADLLRSGRLTDGAVHLAAARTEGVTASFTKELIRRVVINAALAGRQPSDADVSRALDEMLSDAETLTRTLLGGEGPSLVDAAQDDAESDEDWPMPPGPPFHRSAVPPGGPQRGPRPRRTPRRDAGIAGEAATWRIDFDDS